MNLVVLEGHYPVKVFTSISMKDLVSSLAKVLDNTVGVVLLLGLFRSTAVIGLIISAISQKFLT
jgi:hypothetical protein